MSRGNEPAKEVPSNFVGGSPERTSARLIFTAAITLFLVTVSLSTAFFLRFSIFVSLDFCVMSGVSTHVSIDETNLSFLISSFEGGLTCLNGLWLVF